MRRQFYKKQMFIVVMMVMVSLFIMACPVRPPAPDVKVDPILQSKAAYADALKIYYENASTYKAYFRVADEATQAKWRQDISPIFADAKDALDMWKYFNDNGLLPDDQTTSDWKIAKTEFLIKLNSMGAK